MMRKLTQTEYGFTAGGSLANGALYVDATGRVYFLTDDEAHQLSALPKQESKRAEITANQIKRFESAISSAEFDGPAPDVDPRLHIAAIAAMDSQLDDLRDEAAHEDQP